MSFPRLRPTSKSSRSWPRSLPPRRMGLPTVRGHSINTWAMPASLKLPTVPLTTRRVWMSTPLGPLVPQCQLAASEVRSLRVGPTTSVPQTIHQQAFIPQVSTTSTHHRPILAALLAPTIGHLATLTYILRALLTDKEHPPIHRWIHYTPLLDFILDQLQLIRQTHIRPTPNYLEIISIHPRGCLRKGIRILHLVDLRSSSRQDVFTQICPITHPRLHRR
jgi:hypothetical protein